MPAAAKGREHFAGIRGFRATVGGAGQDRAPKINYSF